MRGPGSWGHGAWVPWDTTHCVWFQVFLTYSGLFLFHALSAFSPSRAAFFTEQLYVWFMKFCSIHHHGLCALHSFRMYLLSSELRTSLLHRTEAVMAATTQHSPIAPILTCTAPKSHPRSCDGSDDVALSQSFILTCTAPKSRPRSCEGSDVILYIFRSLCRLAFCGLPCNVVTPLEGPFVTSGRSRLR